MVLRKSLSTKTRGVMVEAGSVDLRAILTEV